MPAACPGSAPPPPPGSPAARHHQADRETKPEQQRTHRAACPGFFLFPSSRPAPAPALPRRRPDDDGDGLPDLPGLGGVGLPDEQRTACPITCPGCSFRPDTAADLMTPPICCPHPCQTYRQRQPPACQHPAASQMNQHNAHDRPHRRPDGKRITPAAWPKPYRIAPDLPPAAQAPPRQSPATYKDSGSTPPTVCQPCHRPAHQQPDSCPDLSGQPAPPRPYLLG